MAEGNSRLRALRRVNAGWRSDADEAELEQAET